MKLRFKEDVIELPKISIRVEVEPVLDEDIVSENPEDKYDDQTLEDWYDFAVNIEGLIERYGDVIRTNHSKHDDSLSEYIDFYLKDDDGNRKEGLIDLRLSDHKQTKNGKIYRKTKTRRLDPNFRLVSITVNNRTFHSYTDALLYAKRLLMELKNKESM